MEVRFSGYYRAISQALQDSRMSGTSTDAGFDDLKRGLTSLLEYTLAFDKADWVPGSKAHAKYFVCAWIEVKDLPWHITQEDW